MSDEINSGLPVLEGRVVFEVPVPKRGRWIDLQLDLQDEARVRMGPRFAGERIHFRSHDMPGPNGGVVVSCDPSDEDSVRQTCENYAKGYAKAVERGIKGIDVPIYAYPRRRDLWYFCVPNW